MSEYKNSVTTSYSICLTIMFKKKSKSKRDSSGQNETSANQSLYQNAHRKSRISSDSLEISTGANGEPSPNLSIRSVRSRKWPFFKMKPAAEGDDEASIHSRSSSLIEPDGSSYLQSERSSVIGIPRPDDNGKYLPISARPPSIKTQKVGSPARESSYSGLSDAGLIQKSPIRPEHTTDTITNGIKSKDASPLIQQSFSASMPAPAISIQARISSPLVGDTDSGSLSSLTESPRRRSKTDPPTRMSKSPTTASLMQRVLTLNSLQIARLTWLQSLLTEMNHKLYHNQSKIANSFRECFRSCILPGKL